MKVHSLSETSGHRHPLDRKVEALEVFIERKEMLRRTTPLRYLFWESTLRCNLECLHCGSDCFRSTGTRDSEIEARLVMDELSAIARVYPPQDMTFAIIGGEPLVRDEICEVGAYAASLGYNWGITTNAMLLKPGMIERLKAAGLKTISVSLDGVKDDHDRLRNHAGSHAIVTRAIGDLLADRFYSEFDVICCVSKININHLEEFMDDVAGLGIPAIRFTPVFSRGRAARNRDLRLTGGDYHQLLSFIKEQRAARPDIRINLSEEGYWGPQWECVVRDEFHYCSSGIMTGSILHDGSVTGCPSVSRRFIEGNIRETPFVEIWRTRFERYRGDRQKTFPRQCADCEHWVLCEGGGFHLIDQDDAPTVFCCLDKLSKEESHE